MSLGTSAILKAGWLVCYIVFVRRCRMLVNGTHIWSYSASLHFPSCCFVAIMKLKAFSFYFHKPFNNFGLSVEWAGMATNICTYDADPLIAKWLMIVETLSAARIFCPENNLIKQDMCAQAGCFIVVGGQFFAGGWAMCQAWQFFGCLRNGWCLFSPKKRKSQRTVPEYLFLLFTNFARNCRIESFQVTQAQITGMCSNSKSYSALVFFASQTITL